MSDTGDELRLLAASARSLGVDLSPAAARRIVAYEALLERWNRRINLVSFRSPAEVRERHVIDSLALLPHIPGGARHLVDVGSGAGLPGAVLAMARPELAVTALEPTHKKWAFLASVRRELGLRNFDPRPMRMEDLPAENSYDVAVSRATWPVEEWLGRGAALIRRGGRVLAMEGRTPSRLPDGATRFPYRLGDRARAVIVWCPGASSPSR